MKLYFTNSRWVGTKEEAMNIAKQFSVGWEPVEVPYDKAGLIEFLNQLQLPAAAVEIVAAPEVVAELTLAQKQVHRTAIEAAILESPLSVTYSLAELVMSRLSEFAYHIEKDKNNFEKRLLF